MLDKEKTPESRCIINHTINRLKKKLSCMMLFTGESGRGKSYAGLRFLEIWYDEIFDEVFPINHVVENLSQAILLVKDFKRIGEGILVEELSVLAGSRDSLTTQNKLWNRFIDTCRIKQAVIIANCPHISFIDKHFQMMCQVWVDCLGVNFRKKIVIAKPYWLQTSPHRKEPYHHSFVGDDGMPINFCYFEKPSKELLQEYDSFKLKNVHDLYEDIALKMKHDRIKKLKDIGQKTLPKRELEAYLLKLEGYSSKEGAEEMGLKDYRTFNRLIKSAKKRLNDPNYIKFAKEMGVFGVKTNKKPHLI